MGHGAMHSYVLEIPEGNPRHLGLHIIYMVGGFNPSEKYEFGNGKDEIPYMKWKILKSCSKPSTRYIYIYILYISIE